jgi:mevalonate kinase
MMKLETISATAPGKIILLGEHAVVYDRPAIAVPVAHVFAQATIEPRDDERVIIDAADLAHQYDLRDAPTDDPLAMIIRLTCAKLGVVPRGFRVRVESTIPIGGGLGSGAAVSVAIARALNKFFTPEGTGKRDLNSVSPVFSVVNLSSAEISALAYEVEKLHHGTPSGIDNTVIAFEQPVYFVKGKPIESFRIARPFTLAIADTGIAAPTKIAVGDVRRAWEQARARYEALFDQVGEIVDKARAAIERGAVERLGYLMNANQALLREMGVSSPEIERLILAARTAGARGAKLAGAGRGGNVIALVKAETRAEVERALIKAGAKRVIVAEIR